MSFTPLPRRWVNAAAVFFRQRMVSRYAEQTGQHREMIYRDAHRVKQQLEDGELLQDELQKQIETLQTENAQLHRQLEHNPFEDPDKVAQYAALAQAEGVSLPVSQRLLKILRRTGRRR